MKQDYPELSMKIAEMSDGDEMFRSQLTTAIKTGLEELKEKYAEGLTLKDKVIIQQVRHKVKPTLMLFGFDDLTQFLNEGKEILESEGFNQRFERHAALVYVQLDKAIFSLQSLV